jgi:hypothetical protein
VVVLATQAGSLHDRSGVARFGVKRRKRRDREPAVRYEWPCPGDSLHLDVEKLGVIAPGGGKRIHEPVSSIRVSARPPAQDTNRVTAREGSASMPQYGMIVYSPAPADPNQVQDDYAD